jgi:26S proteasome regulatory subunit N11
LVSLIVYTIGSLSWWLQVKEEGEMDDPEERFVSKVGKLDAKKNIDKTVQNLMAKNILQCMGTMLDTVVF